MFNWQLGSFGGVGSSSEVNVAFPFHRSVVGGQTIEYEWYK